MTKQEVISYYESPAYEAEVKKNLKQAKQILNEYMILQDSLADKAVVLDVDETSLSHYKSLKKADFPQGDEIWENLIFDVHVGPVQSTLDFYNYCVNIGLKVFFISARFAHSLRVTEQALKNAGYAQFEQVFVLPKNVKEYKYQEFRSFKAGRRAYIESLGYKVLVNIGDQKSDLLGGYALNTIQLPNYLYGENSAF